MKITLLIGALGMVALCLAGVGLLIQPIIGAEPDVFPGGVVKKDTVSSPNWRYGFRRDQVIALPRDSEGVYSWYLERLALPPRGTRNSERCLSAEGANPTPLGLERTGVVVCMSESAILVVINQEYDYSTVKPYFSLRGWQSLIRQAF